MFELTVPDLYSHALSSTCQVSVASLPPPPPDPPMLCVGYTLGTDCNATANTCDVIVSTAVKLQQISPIFVIESAK